MSLKKHSFVRLMVAMGLALVIAIVQYSLLPYIFNSRVIPDFMFILFLFVASRRPFLESVAIGILMGLWCGMLSGNGAYLLAFVWGVAGCLLPIASQGVYMKDFFPGAGYVAVMYLFTKVCGLLLFAAVDLNTEDKWWRLLGYLPLMSVTAVCGPPVFWLLSGLSFFKDEEATVSRTSIMLIRRG